MRTVILFDNQVDVLIKILEKIKNTKVDKDTTIKEIVEMSDAAGVLAVIDFQLKKMQK